MKTKFILLLSGSILLWGLSKAQNTTIGKQNFYQIQKQFYAHYEQLEKQGRVDKKEIGEKEDGLLTQFHRWEYLMKARTFPSGNMPAPDIQWREWKRFQEANAEQFAQTSPQAAWQQVGTNTVPLLGGGAGRINVIRFDPANSNIIYIGAAGGGVWKTTNGGTTWTCLSDNFPVTSIADIAIDAANSNNIYAATGDGYGYEIGGSSGFWGGVYTAGVMHSTNGGTTWTQIGIKVPQSANTIIQRMIINPANNQILLAAAREGIFRTANGGNTWTKVLNSHCYDMEWKTNDANTVYAGGGGVVYKSTNAGATWSTLKTGFGSGRMSIEVSAADPLVIYSLNESGGLYKTTDGGVSWVTKSYPYAAGFYGYYDLSFACSQSNSNTLIAGGLSTAKSTDGAGSWSTIDNYSSYTASNYVHADKHAAAFYAGSTTNILVAGDGGIWRTVNGGTTWTDLSKGLMIAQIYRLGTTPQNTNLYISGWQDNGCNRWDGTNWTHIFGADGMEAAIDYTNQNTYYEAYQYGALNRSYNSGVSWSYIAPSSGDWITPFIIDPVLNTRLYYGGYSTLYRSNNQGGSWSAVTGVALNDYATEIAVAPSNNNIVYAAALGKMYKADISTNTATNITAGLPVTLAGVYYIAVSNTDENKVFVSLSGYAAGQKVYYSSNGGATWSNISLNLPNLPVNTIVYQNNSNNRVYAGTDIGVFYKDNSLANWVYYGNGLPNVMVHELEINYTSNKLVAATYGRGIWQVDLVSPSPNQQVTTTNNEKRETRNEFALKVNVSPNPTNGILNIQVQDATADVTVDVYRVNGGQVATFSFSAKDAASMQINLRNQMAGNYVLHIRSGDAMATKEITLSK